MRNAARDSRLRRLVALIAVLGCATAATARMAAFEAGLSLSGQVSPRAATPRGQAAPVARPPASVVSVEPFVNISGNPADAWLGVGIAETVATDLDAQGLTVVDTHDARAGRGAHWVVTGGYQRLGERVRITARLVDADTGAVAQSVRLDGALGEIFALQDRIVVELTTGIDLTAGAARPGGAGVRSPGTLPGSGAAAGAFGRARAPSAGSSVPPRPSGSGSGRPPAPAGFVEGVILPRPSRAGAGVPPADEPDPVPPVPAERADAALPAAAGGNAPVGVMGGPAAGFTPAAGILAGRPSVEPVRTSDPPSIDGRLDDAV